MISPMDTSSDSKWASPAPVGSLFENNSFLSSSFLSPTTAAEPAPLTNAASAKKKNRWFFRSWDTLDSLHRLLGTLKNFECYEGHYILINEITTDNWKQFIEIAQAVKSFHVNETTERNDAQISAALFIRLAQLLRGEPLLPSLHELQIVPTLCPSLQQHLSLLISPSLKIVKTEAPQVQPKSGTTNFRPAMKVFLAGLALNAPSIEELYLGPGVPEIPLSWITHITSLQHLRKLELRPVIDVKGIESLRPMESLTLLEVLWLEIDISQVVSARTSTDPVVKFLPSLIKLDITGPLRFISDFLDAVKAVGLKDLTINTPRIPEAINTPRIPEAVKPPEVDKKTKPSSKQGTQIIPVAVAPSPTTAQEKPSDSGSVFVSVKGRWSRSLEEICVTTGNSCACDLSDLSELRALRKLSIQGSQILSLDRMLAASDDLTLWTKMTSLRLSSSSLSLSQLGKVAKLAPLLDEGIFHLGLERIPDLGYVQPIQHPLTILTVIPDPNGVAESHLVEFPSMIKIARYLNMIFPGIKSLKGPQARSQWNEIWDLVRLCQEVRKDDQDRIPKPAEEIIPEI